MANMNKELPQLNIAVANKTPADPITPPSSSGTSPNNPVMPLSLNATSSTTPPESPPRIMSRYITSSPKLESPHPTLSRFSTEKTFRRNVNKHIKGIVEGEGSNRNISGRKSMEKTLSVERVEEEDEEEEEETKKNMEKEEKRVSLPRRLNDMILKGMGRDKVVENKESSPTGSMRFKSLNWGSKDGGSGKGKGKGKENEGVENGDKQGSKSDSQAARSKFPEEEVKGKRGFSWPWNNGFKISSIMGLAVGSEQERLEREEQEAKKQRGVEHRRIFRDAEFDDTKDEFKDSGKVTNNVIDGLAAAKKSLGPQVIFK